MIRKNKEKLERKNKRKPPIPVSKMTKTKSEKIISIRNKHKNYETN